MSRLLLLSLKECSACRQTGEVLQHCRVTPHSQSQLNSCIVAVRRQNTSDTTITKPSKTDQQCSDAMNSSGACAAVKMQVCVMLLPCTET